MEIFYEDLMENFYNKNLRERLMNLVNEHKIIIVKGLSSAERHTVYRQMYYPLKFEKIVLNENDEENTDIRIYNCKIKQKEKKQNDKNHKNENNQEKTEETKKEEEYVLEDSEHSEDSEEESSSNSGYESESEEDSYLTEEDEQLTRLEDIGSQILERVVKNEKKIDRTRGRVNLIIVFNIISCILLYTLFPMQVINIRTTECEIY